MARVNYQREKRMKDLDRQRKQEEKRTRKLQKNAGTGTDAENTDNAAETGDTPAPEDPS